MKVIVLGSTGFIGTEVLNTLLASPSITTVVALARRSISPGDKIDKLTTIVHNEFKSYSQSLLDQLSGAEACIFCLGSKSPFLTASQNREINYEYALAAANAFTSLAATSPSGTFKFIYVSGALTEKNPEQRLWVAADFRRLRGELEVALMSLGAEQRKRNTGFEAYIARPGVVLPDEAVVRLWLTRWVIGAIGLKELARSIVDIGIRGLGPGGGEDYEDNGAVLLENSLLLRKGRQLEAM